MVTYADVSQTFEWRVPDRYNIAADTIDRHAAKRPDAPALVYEEEPGNVKQLSFKDVRDASNRLANALGAQGLVFGDRIAILLPQAPETAIAHVAAYKSALIAVPLFVLFGPEAIEYRLVNSGSVALITDLRNWPKVAEIHSLPALVTVIVVGGRGITALRLRRTDPVGLPDFVTVDTAPTIRPSSSIPRARRGTPRVRSTRTACCSDTCPASRFHTTTFRSRTTCSGRRQTGRGSAVSSTC